jgi:hypothetical protein
MAWDTLNNQILPYVTVISIPTSNLSRPFEGINVNIATIGVCKDI